MDPWSPSVPRRAYTAAPMAPAVGVFHATTWVFSYNTKLGWASLGIVVPSRDVLAEIEQFRRLTSRGVRMGTIDQVESARCFDRVLIAYRPDAVMLERVEALENIPVVVAIGDDHHQLHKWVGEHRPVHLGGTDLVAGAPAPWLGRTSAATP